MAGGGASLPKRGSVRELGEEIAARASQLFHSHRYEAALRTYMYCLALDERSGAALDGEYREWRGAMLHNIGSCLHHIGEPDAARYVPRYPEHKPPRAPAPTDLSSAARAVPFYEIAMRDFERAGAGASNRRRIAFVRERLNLISAHAPPDASTYLDSTGTRRFVDVDARGMRAAQAADAEEPLGHDCVTLLRTLPNPLRPWRGSGEDSLASRTAC